MNSITTNDDSLELNEKTKRAMEKLDGGNVPMDQNVIPLLNAINSLDGIRTRSSCGGHPDRYPSVLVWADGTEKSMASLCILVHALKSYHWKLVAMPVGAIGDLHLDFMIMPDNALREWREHQPPVSILASETSLVEETQAQLDNIAGRILTLAGNSRFVPRKL